MDLQNVVNLAACFARIPEPWKPHVVGELNGQHIKLARLRGEFIWHHHDDADELFLVISGRLTIQMRVRAVTLEPGEFFIVPRGVEHLPIAEPEAEVLLFEPIGTLNTGNIRNERTVEHPDHMER